MMTVDHRSAFLEPVRSTLTLMLHPVRYAVDLPTSIAHWTSESLTERARLVKENRELKAAQFHLNARLQKLVALEQENARLRELLASAARFQEQRVLVAHLMAVDLDPYRQQIVINRGANDGVYVGQPLLDADGVMGQITHVDAVSATAILISDPSHAVPVQINRNGVRTLVVGTGDANVLRLRHMPVSGDIKVGDIVSTSGLGGRFPPDYPVAEISHIARPSGEPFATVEARPFAHLDRSREVLLVWPKLERPPQGNTTETTAIADDAT